MKTRPTAVGIGFLVGVVLLGIAGLTLGYRELLLLAIGGLILQAIAMLLPGRGTDVELERRLQRTLVQVGDPVEVELEITSPDATPALTLVDTVAGDTVRLAVPALKAGGTATVSYRMRSTVRGVHSVGPIGEERRDPFDLAIRQSEHEVRDELFVHPVIHKLYSVENAFSIWRPNNPRHYISDDPLADFRAMREYVPGDDSRLVHWPSSARAGRLLVRDFLDLRRTSRTVLLDTSATVMSAQQFEQAVEIAASLVCDALDLGLTSMFLTTDKRVPQLPEAVKSRGRVLERFCRVEQTTPEDTADVAAVLRGDAARDQLFLVTGVRSNTVSQLLRRQAAEARLFVVRVSDANERGRPLPVPSVDVRSGIDFVLALRRAS